MSLKIIDKNLRTITTNASKLNGLIHDTGMLILAHAMEHGDCTRALSLVKAMPASMRKTMLVAWFEKYSPIRVIEANGKVGMLKDSAKGFVPFNLEGAAAEPFYVIAERTPEAKPFDLAAMMKFVEATVKRIEKNVTEGNVPDADRSTAEALLEQMRGIKVTKVVADNDPNNIPLVDIANPRIAAAA